MPSARRHDQRTSRLESGLACGIALAVLLSFWPALGADFVAWDDDLNLTDNPSYRGLSPTHLRWMLTTTHGGHWQPLTWLTLALDHRVWGMNAGGYHATNLLLHAATAVVFFALTLTLLRRAAPAHGTAVAFAAASGALFFAVHPLRVESVAWVSERRDVLSGLFYLLTVLAYLRMHAGEGGSRRPWLALSLACFVLSLLSKAWGMTLPVVLLILDAYPLARLRRDTWRAVAAEKALYAVPAAAAAILAWAAQSSVEEMRTLEAHGVAARLAQAAYGLCFYVWKTVLPARLSPIYLLEESLDPAAPRYLLSMLAVASVTTVLLALRRRAPWALAAWAAYVVIVSPVLGLAQTGPQLVADRYTYLACLPWALLAAAVLLRLRRASSLRAITGAGLAVLAIAVLAAATFRQTAIWKDSLTLWSHAIALDRTSYLAFTNRGWVQPTPEAAIADYSEAVRLNPRYYLAYFNRGNVFHAEGDYAAAIADYTRAIEILPGDPKAWNNRGWSREAAGDREGAARDYAEALARARLDWPDRALVEGDLARARARPEQTTH
jgi:tetratricopeptide (TPR) repeat protein